MTDPGRTYDYPLAVRFQITTKKSAIMFTRADFLDTCRIRRCFPFNMNTEFFGGEAGGNIIEALVALEMPIVTTLHSILAEPTLIPARRDACESSPTSTKIIVMSEKGRELLRSVHGRANSQD